METKRTDLLTRKQAAEYLGMSVSWMQTTKAGPMITRIGSKPKYLVSDLDEYINSRRGLEKDKCLSTSAKAQKSTGASSMSVANHSENQRVKQITSELKKKSADYELRRNQDPGPPPQKKDVL